MKEAPIQKAILEYLTLKQVFHWRQNSGAFQTASGGFYHMGTVGAPDIICCKDGQLIGIEVKAKRGKLRESQEVFRARLLQAGGQYIIARSVDDVIAAGL